MRQSIEIKPSLLWQARWKAGLEVVMSRVRGQEGGRLNCMDWPSWRWQGLINKHRGLQKQSTSCSTQTMRQKVGQSIMKSQLKTPNIMPALGSPEMSSVLGLVTTVALERWRDAVCVNLFTPGNTVYSFQLEKQCRMNHGLLSRLPKIILRHQRQWVSP